MYYKFSYYQNFTTFFCSKRPIFNISQAFVKKMPTTLPFKLQSQNENGNWKAICKIPSVQTGNRAIFAAQKGESARIAHRKDGILHLFCTAAVSQTAENQRFRGLRNGSRAFVSRETPHRPTPASELPPSKLAEYVKCFYFVAYPCPSFRCVEIALPLCSTP